MAVLYSNDFESPALHAQASADFTVSQGSSFLVFHSGAGNIGAFPEVTFVGGVRSYGTRDNDSNFCNLVAARADSGMRTAQSYRAGQCIGHFHRMTEGQDRGIVCSFDNSGGFIRGRISVQSSGSVELSESGFDLAVTTGDVIHMESLVVGTLTSLRIWKNAEPRPATATVTHTSAVWTTGRVGLRMTGNQSNYRTLDNLVITDAAGGEDFFYPASSGPTINTQPSNASVTAPTAATFTVAATSSGGTLTYQWQQSTNGGSSWANVTSGTGGTTASYNTGTTAVSGGNANNGDQYRCVVTDSNGSVNSSAATLTVTVPLATAAPISCPEHASQSGFSGVVLSAAAPGAGVTVLQTFTGLSLNGSGAANVSVSGLGQAVGAVRYVIGTQSDGNLAPGTNPRCFQGPVALT